MSIFPSNKLPIQPQKKTAIIAPRGLSGFSAYQLAQLNGFTGTEVEWLDSLKAVSGDTVAIGDLVLSSVESPTVTTNNGQRLILQAPRVIVTDTVTGSELRADVGGVNIASGSGIVNVEGDTTFNGAVKAKGAVVLDETQIPATSHGQPGDIKGMIAFGPSYIYYCSANYVNESTDIWKRVALTGGRW